MVRKFFYLAIGFTVGFIVASAIVDAIADTRDDHPRIINEWMGKDRCLPDDPIGPCPTLNIRVFNPLDRDVWVKLDCGTEYFTTAKGTIRSRKSITFEMASDMPGGLRPGECVIKSWERVR